MIRIATLALLCAVLLVVHSQSAAQSKSAEASKYWVTFVDKDNGFGKGPAAVEPGYVTDRALKRRALRGRVLNPTIDAPVSEHYQNELRAIGLEPVTESRWLNAVSVYLTVEEISQVRELGFVRAVDPVAKSDDMAVEPGPIVEAAHSAWHAPADGSYSLDYGASRGQLEFLNAIDPIEEGFIGTGVRLGVLDTTTDTLHPALQHLHQSGRVIAVRDFTVEAGLPRQSNSHGLNTSSTALSFDEGTLISPCYGAEYLFGTTEYAPFERNAEEDFFVAGMEWMERMGADIVNVSLGYSEFDDGQESYTYEDMDGNTAKTTIASDKAAELGVVVISSAGNEGNGSWRYITSPADGDSVIAVGAVNSNGNLASFSGRGPSYDQRMKPDVAALGVSVLVATAGGGYSGSANGTSFSSPFVASVACQILQSNPNLNPIDVRTILRSTASRAANPDNNFGWGIVDASAAVSLSKGSSTAREQRGDLPENTVELTVYPNPASGSAVVGVGSQEPSNVQIGLYDILGRRVGSAVPTGSATAIRTYRLDLDGLASGLYMVRLEGPDVERVETLIVR